MKQGIHPKTYATVYTCTGCSTQWPSIATKENLRLDVCSKCHPFYTGEQRILDTAGQVDRFMKRLKVSQDAQAVAASRGDAKKK
ncbi:MAG: 50S ribosomal protein L31 [Roseiflexaceae bacterium]|nr:MAG: 50S ribosomal protein L31 [Chloroflexota bacterium]